MLGIKKRRTFEALLKYDGLLRSIVQWGYWDAEHRSDIVDELVNNECETIAGCWVGKTCNDLFSG